MKTNSTIGSVWLLEKLPPKWIFAIFAVCVGIVPLLRIVFERKYYDYSFASMPGDVLLLIYLVLVSWCLHKTKPGNGLYRSKVWHLLTFIGWLAIGITLQMRAWHVHGGKETVANSFHNVVVVSLLGYTIVSTLPLLVNKNWLRSARAMAFACLLGWFGLLLYDIQHGNLEKNTPDLHNASFLVSI
jgi:hypothetical protein